MAKTRQNQNQTFEKPASVNTDICGGPSYNLQKAAHKLN
jgi:hypothetical protein